MDNTHANVSNGKVNGVLKFTLKEIIKWIYSWIDGCVTESLEKC